MAAWRQTGNESGYKMDGLENGSDGLNSDRYFETVARWLALEGDAERQRMAERRRLMHAGNAERSGETIVNLRLTDNKIGLAGRLLLDLEKPGAAPLPMNRLKVGSPIVVTSEEETGDEGVPGVVSRRRMNSIQVAVERWPENGRLRLDLSPDETTRRRQLAAMGAARRARGASARLRDILLENREPRFDAPPTIEFVTDLNGPQEDAVRFALSARDLAVIHGPPGTGKTTTLAEVIAQAVRQGDRVLACAPSNTAVDNLLERLLEFSLSALRVGHPARVFESLRGHTLDERVASDSHSKVVREIQREIEQLMRRAARLGRGRDARRTRGRLHAEAGALRAEAKQLERSAIAHVLDSADVICTTTTIDEDLLIDQHFDLVVIDEACQCTEAAVWQPLLQADRMILAGDHCQLPPTVVSEQASREGFSRSTMERLVQRFGGDIFRRLQVQYRMPNEIMEFSSNHFYDAELIADASVRERTIYGLDNVEANDPPLATIEFWDSSGAQWDEELEPDGLSKRNPKEGEWVIDQVRRLQELGVRGDQIAVIAPYAAQVRWLRNRLHACVGLEIDTVDGFQGREKEAVLLTMVRSNADGEIGFLKDTRRTNVAMTRAKRLLRVVGDGATLSTHAFYREWIEYFESRNAYHTVWELDQR